MKRLTLFWQSLCFLAVLYPFVYFQWRWKVLVGRNHLPPSELYRVPGHLAVQPHECMQHFPVGSLCRHPHPSCSSKLQSHWLRQCQESSPGSTSRGCPRLSLLISVYPSAASLLLALVSATLLVSLGKSPFPSSDAPTTLMASTQVPTGAWTLALGLFSRAEPRSPHCTVALISRDQALFHASPHRRRKYKSVHQQIPNTQFLLSIHSSWTEWEPTLDTLSIGEQIWAG